MSTNDASIPRVHHALATATIIVAAALAALAAAPSQARGVTRLGERTLREGTTGRDVGVLQKYLTRARITTRVTHEFDVSTDRSVRRFERAARMRVDGVVTPADARRLRARVLRISSEIGGGPGGAAFGQRPEGPGVAGRARLASDGTAIPPVDAPESVRNVIAAGNRIAHKPYVYGGGHGSFSASGYDCSGSVSYALHGGRLLNTQLTSGDFAGWGASGKGRWVTIYANGGHVYMVVAGLRFDTSMRGSDTGSRWQKAVRSPGGFAVRHPKGL
ncbi:MAG: peptidoglycan-binding protein [Solirubrobacteraceae bacterium]